MHEVTYVMIIRGHNPRIHELQHLYSFIQQPPVVKWGSGRSLTMQTSAVWHWQKLCLLRQKTPVHVFEQKGNLLTLFCDVHTYVSPSLYLKSCYGLSECAYKNLTVNVALVTTQRKPRIGPHLYQVLVHPLCEGLFLDSVSFICNTERAQLNIGLVRRGKAKTNFKMSSIRCAINVFLECISSCMLRRKSPRLTDKTIFSSCRINTTHLWVENGSCAPVQACIWVREHLRPFTVCRCTSVV